MRNPAVIAQFAQLDRDGKLDEIKKILDPRTAEAEIGFFG